MLYSAGYIAVGQIIRDARIAGNYASEFPLSAGVSGFLLKLAPRRVERGLSLLYHTGTQFYPHLSQTVAILLYHHVAAVGRNGDDVDPRRVFEHVEFVVDTAVGKFHGVAPGCEPRTPEQIFRREGLPALAVVSLEIVHREG